MTFQDTLEKLRQLEKEDDTIDPSLPPASPTVDLVLENRGALFMATLSAQFTRALEHLSIFSPRFTVGDLLAPVSSYSHALVFTSLQVRSRLRQYCLE